MVDLSERAQRRREYVAMVERVMTDERKLPPAVTDGNWRIAPLPTLEHYDRQHDEGRRKWHERCNSRRRRQDRDAIYQRPWDRD